MGGRFADRVIWITGGGSGLGSAMALAFVREGGVVALSGRRVDRLEAVAAELEAAGGRALVVPCDVTVPEQVQAAVDAVVGELGRLDIAVANAGFAVGGAFMSLSAADWQRQLAVNVVGLTTTARCAIPALEKTGGQVVLIGSVAAYIGLPGSSAYGSSKAAVRYIGAALSAELSGSGVCCTTIHPGFVESEIAQVDNQGRFDAERPDHRPQRLMWGTERAAKVMVGAVYRRRREFVFTGHGHFAAFMGQRLPRLAHWIVSLGAARGRKASSR